VYEFVNHFKYRVQDELEAFRVWNAERGGEEKRKAKEQRKGS